MISWPSLPSTAPTIWMFAGWSSTTRIRAGSGFVEQAAGGGADFVPPARSFVRLNSCCRALVKLFDQQGEFAQMFFQIRHGIIFRVAEQFLRVMDQRFALPALPQAFESLREYFAFIDGHAVADGRPRLNRATGAIGK